MRRFERVLVPLMFVFTALGCETSSSSSSTSTSAAAITSILVDPAFFMGDMPCAKTDGAMQSYVAQIFDVTDPDKIFTLAASPPTPCAAAVTFRQVVVDHKYQVTIAGYDLAADKLSPLGGGASGGATMYLKEEVKNGTATNPVLPKWSTKCDDVTAVEDTRIGVQNCDPFKDIPTTTGVVVDPRDAMVSANPALTCADVFAFHVRPDDPSLPALLNFPCTADGPPPPAFAQSTITAGQTYTFRIEAIATDGGPVVWGSSCSATTRKGLVIDAACDPFRTDGALEIVLDAQKCMDTSTATFDATYPGPPEESITQVICGRSVRFSPLEPGMHAAAVVGHDATSGKSLEASCSGLVEPGKVTTATCMFF